jgi:hypothetical protein
MEEIKANKINAFTAPQTSKSGTQPIMYPISSPSANRPRKERYHPCHVSQADDPEENHPPKDESEFTAENEPELEETALEEEAALDEEAALEEASSPPPLLPSSKEESSSPTRSTILPKTG